MDIGKRIRSRRMEMNMTQDELAEKLLVSRPAVSNWETGKNYPDLQIIVMLSEVLDVSLDDLLKGDANVVEQITKDTRESGKLRKRIRVLIGIVAILLVAVAAVYVTVWKPTYMTYEESGLYVKDNALMTNERYYSFQSYDSSDNNAAFIYMTTTFYENHKGEKATGDAASLMNLDVYGRSIVHDDKGNVAVSDQITEVYYVPESEVRKLNQKGGYWSESEAENKEKADHLKSISELVWKAE